MIFFLVNFTSQINLFNLLWKILNINLIASIIRDRFLLKVSPSSYDITDNLKQKN
jgi:hypothetical protein